MQILINLVLYGFMAFLVYESAFVGEPDYFMTFCVAFVMLVALITKLMPSLHVDKCSPGEYPYED
jgi:hypothetical protein